LVRRHPGRPVGARGTPVARVEPHAFEREFDGAPVRQDAGLADRQRCAHLCPQSPPWTERTPYVVRRRGTETIPAFVISRYRLLYESRIFAAVHASPTAASTSRIWPLYGAPDPPGMPPITRGFAVCWLATTLNVPPTGEPLT